MGARNKFNDASTQDSLIESQIKSNSKAIDTNLAKMESHFGKEYLEGLSEAELYSLYKRFLSKQ